MEGERFFAAPSLQWLVAPQTTVTFRSEFSHDDRSTTLALPYANGRVIDRIPYDRYFGEPGFTEMESQAGRGLLELNHRWNEDNRTTVSFHGVATESEGGNFILFNFTGPLQDPVTGDIARSAEQVDFTGEYFTTRVDHIWDSTIYEGADSGSVPEVTNRLLVSGEFDRQEVQGSRVLSGHTPLNPYNPVYTGYSPSPLLPGLPQTITERRDTEGDAYSLLLLDRVSFGEKVFVSFGGRYEWFDASSESVFPAPAEFFGSANDLREETFNPTVGLVVKPLRNLSLFASYSESTHSFQNIHSATPSGDPLDAERSQQYEAGVKVEFLEGRLFSSVALFQIDKGEVAAAHPTNFLFSSAADEQSRGVEFDLGGEILPGWRVVANYAYIDARVSDDDFNPGNIDNRLPGVPEHSGGLFTTYEIQEGALRGFGFGGGTFLSDRVKVDRENTGDLPGWVQVDAVAYYRWKQLLAQLNVKNVFDREFYYAGSFGSEVQRAAPRTFLASLKYEF